MSTELADCIPGNDIPQADNLLRLRLSIDAIAAGMKTQEQIVEYTRITSRHVAYALHAARVLGFLNQEPSYRLTDMGRALCATRRMSDEERACIKQAYARSPVLTRLAPGLFDEPGPSLETIAGNIEEHARLARATARRRAQTLLSWRIQILEPEKYRFLLEPAAE